DPSQVRKRHHGSVGTCSVPATISFSSESTLALTGAGIKPLLRSSYTHDTPCSASPKSRTPLFHSPALSPLIVSNTAVSTRLTIRVSTRPGASSYWSESTPIASFFSSRAASNTPRPVEPEAWKTMSAPAWYSASPSSLPFVGSLNAAPVVPAYFTSTSAFGLTAFAPST